MGDFIDVCGLWLKDGKKGKFFCGKLKRNQYSKDFEDLMASGDDVMFFINKNHKKQGDRDPDYKLSARRADSQGEKKKPASASNQEHSYGPPPMNDGDDVDF